jgi:hypothetical protein
MLKKMLLVSCLPLLLAGCTTTFTNLTPQHQARRADNMYPVEVSMVSRQASIRWDTIKPQIAVDNELYSMRPVMLMTNRWEGLLPVPPGKTVILYRYKLNYDCSTIGGSKPGSATSPQYRLKITD